MWQVNLLAAKQYMFSIESSIYESYQSSSIRPPNAFGTWFAFSSSMTLLYESYQRSSSNVPVPECLMYMVQFCFWLLHDTLWKLSELVLQRLKAFGTEFTFHFFFYLSVHVSVCCDLELNYMYPKSQRTIVFYTLVICLFCTVPWNRWICFCLYFCESQGCNKCY